MGDDPAAGALRGFLPPEPSGPEPDLGAGPPQSEPSHLGYAPPAQSRPAAGPQAQGSHGYAQPQGADWGSSATGRQQPAQPWSYPPGPAVPDNGAAVAGMSLSVTAGALLLMSVGMSTIISVACAALGIYYSRKGRARVDRGETPKHRGVAHAGVVIGIVTLGLSILATLIWTIVAIQYATDESFRQDLQDELDGDKSSPDGFETSIRAGLTAFRIVASLLR